MVREVGERARLLLLVGRTLRNVPPSQVAHRLRLRLQRRLFRVAPGAFLSCSHLTDKTCWPSAFQPLDASTGEDRLGAEANAKGRFAFLNDTQDLGVPPRWEARHTSRLWRFHLHSFEWVWSFAEHPSRDWAREAFRGLWSSWSDWAQEADDDAWAPYVASKRAWHLCCVYSSLIAGTPVDRAFLEHLAAHTAFIRLNLERDLGGNHLVANLKALIGLSVMFGDDRLLRWSRGELQRQLGIQVLADGGHFERSPSYHARVLADLVDIENLLTAHGRSDGDLRRHTDQMRSWLGTMLHPDGDVPLFHDSVLVGRHRLARLALSPGPEGVAALVPSGYVVYRPRAGFQVVVDVGDPGPSGLPGHAHAGCLSFEVVVDHERVIVDTGVSTYERGPRRAYERSTAAHNTIEIDGYDQSEVWDSFRLGRRATATLHSISCHDGHVRLIAHHDGYERLPGRPSHTRTFVMSATEVRLRDEMRGRGEHEVVWRLHLAPELVPRQESRSAISAGPLLVRVHDSDDRGELSVLPAGTGDGKTSVRFGELRPSAQVVYRRRGRLPMEINTSMTFTSNSD